MEQLTYLTLPSGMGTTEVVIGRNILPRCADLLQPYRQRQVVLVSDQHIEGYYGAALRDALRDAAYDVHLLTIPAGEEAKTQETLTQLYWACHERQIDRDAVIVAVGGGGVGDVAGMLAGTYLRGLAFIQIPTSLVAMVTASIGGKVGINFGGRKNAIGLFYPPTLVVVDVATLRTLPEVELRSGLGELVTVGVLGAPAIFETLERNPAAALEPLLRLAIECKSAIVQADPFDRLDIRAKLNLGHTFGHALEQLSSFTLPHGLAVAVGLHAASRLAAAIQLCPPELPERIRQTLLALDLPVALGGYRAEQVIEAMRGDKKRRAGQIRWVLPRALGDVVMVDEADVPRALLMDVLRPIVEEGDAW